MFERIAIAVILLLTAAPLLLFDDFPTQDGPAHLDSANVVAHIEKAPGSLLAEQTEQTPPLLTNRFSLPVFSTALAIVPPDDAVHLVFSIHIIGLTAVLCLCWALFGNRAALFITLYAPFAYSLVTYYGFTSHLFGATLATLAVLLFLKSREQQPVLFLILFSAATSLSFIGHIFPAAAAAILTGAIAFWDALLRRDAPMRRLQAVMSALIKRLWPTALALAPVALLALAHLATGSQNTGYFEYGLTDKLLSLATFALFSFGWPNLALAIAAALLISTAAFTALRSAPLPDRQIWALVILTMLAVYFALPNWIGPVTLFNWRFAPFVALTLLAPTLYFSPPRHVRALILTGAVLVTTGLTADRLREFQRLEAGHIQLKALQPQLRSQDIVVYLDFTQTSPLSIEGRTLPMLQRDQQFDPFLHGYGYLTAGRDILNASNYQLLPAYNYFPAQIACEAPCDYPVFELTPSRLGAIGAATITTDLSRLTRILGRDADLIVVHVGDMTKSADDRMERLARSLASRGYQKFPVAGIDRFVLFASSYSGR